MLPIGILKVATYHSQNRDMLIGICLSALAFATVAIDFCGALFQHSSFYISESLLFSSFWLLSFPLLKMQFHFTRAAASVYQRLVITSLAVLIHLISFPALVWLLSNLFYHHTFSYQQTLKFGITAYSITAILLYILPLFCYQLWKQNDDALITSIVENEIVVPPFLTSLIVSDTNNRKLSIKTEEILYFSSASPYVHIHHINKKYLHSETLKSFLSQLDPNKFVRIHKSCVVNALFVASYKSRLNGDYDLTLKNGTELRLSRNYAVAFKSVFENR